MTLDEFAQTCRQPENFGVIPEFAGRLITPGPMNTSRLLSLAAIHRTAMAVLATLALLGCDSSDTDDLDGRIAFVDRVDNTFQIFVMNADGSGKRQLTQSGNNLFPRWSPDGSTIIYGANKTGDWNIYAIRPDGSDERVLIPLTSDDDLQAISAPAWSPDGSRLVHTGRRYVYEVNAEGTGLVRLSDTQCNCSQPQWSPNGQRIVLVRGPQDENGLGDFDLFTIAADGTGLVNLTNTPNAREASPAWSPDGNRLAFSRGDGLGWSNIFVMDTDGGNQVQLTRLDSGDLAAGLTWTPDGSMIAFGRINQGLYVIAVDGGRLRKLVSGESASWPDWH